MVSDAVIKEVNVGMAAIVDREVSKERRKQWSREYKKTERGRELRAKAQRKYQATEKGKIAYSNSMIRQGTKRRQALLVLLGGKCAKCGNRDPRVLQVNHLRGHGREERRKFGRIREFYTAVLDGRRSTEDLNLLCANCNVVYDYDINTRSQVTSQHLKVIRLFGSKCMRCESDDPHVLQVHHVNGGGGKEYTNMSSQFYSHILDGRRTTEDLSLLCANCNSIHEYEIGKRGRERLLPIGTIIKQTEAVILSNPFNELRRILKDVKN